MEVVVANALALLFILCISALLGMTLRSMLHADRALEAEVHAHEAIHALRMTPLQDLAIGSRPVESLGTFQREVEVVKAPGIEAEQMKEIRVTVSWRDRGQERKIQRGFFYGGIGD